jgi:hypothetical protein
LIVRTKIGPTSTPKNSKRVIIGLNIEKNFYWRTMLKYFGRKKIYAKCSSEKGFIPKFKRHGCMGK